MFAIQAAVKLGSNMRQAYVNNLKSRELTLPLPKVNMEVNTDQVTSFFEGRPEILSGNPRIKELCEAESMRVLEPHEDKEYRRVFEAAYMAENQKADAELQGDALIGLSTFRQWSKEEDAPLNGLRLVAGTLVEVGVDYLSQVPGAINPNSKYAGALQGVLEAFDGMDLTSREGQGQALQQVAPQLFASVMEVSAGLLPSVTSDPNFKGAIRETCMGVADEVSQRIEKLSTSEDREATKQWGKAIFESTVRHAGTALLAHTDSEKDATAFVSQVSISVMNTLLDKDLSGMKLREVVSGPALDAFLEEGLKGLASNPAWISQNEAMGDILSGIAESALESGFERRNLIPELARITVRQTSAHLDKLIQVDPDRPQALLITASQTLLRCLSEPVPGDAWKPRLSNPELLQLADALVMQVAENPNWIVQEAGGSDSILGQVLHISLDSLRQLPEEKRFSGKALQELLQSSVQAVATNRIMLKALPLVGESGSSALRYTLNAAFAKVYGQEDAKNQWSLAQDAALSELISQALSEIAEQPVSVSVIDKTIELHFGGVESELVSGLLRSIDGISLEGGAKTAFFQQLAPSMLQESVKLIELHSPKWIEEPSFRALLQQSSRQIAQSLASRLSEEEAEQQAWGAWASELGATLLEETGSLAFSASVDLFIDAPNTQHIVNQVGLAMIQAATQSELPLKEVLKGESLRQVIAAGLQTAGEYPEVFGESQALSVVIQGTVQAISDSGVKRPNLVPEILRMVLVKAQGQLNLVWHPDNEQENLLATAVNHTLSILTAPTEGKWKPTFTQGQMLGVVSLVVDEVVENPAWVIDSVGDRPILQDALQATFQAASSVPKAERLSPQTWQVLIKQSLRAVALRQQLLDRLPGQTEAKATVLGYTIDSLLSYLFDNESAQVKWAATKSQILNVLIEQVLNKVAIGPTTPEVVDETIENLDGQLVKIRDNETFDSVMFLRELLV